MANYRRFEDKHGFIKFFADHDIEFEIVIRGLESLKGTEKWGMRAKELEDRFIRAFDGRTCKGVPPCADVLSLYGQFVEALEKDDLYFRKIDEVAFRRIHNECIALFKEVSDAFALLIRDDRRDLL
jgi:hypothetical protein